MPNISERVRRLEALRRIRRAWTIPIIEQRPGVDIAPQLAEIERQARAAGWQPGREPFVIVVEMPAMPA
jgi:hypothetical protein